MSDPVAVHSRRGAGPVAVIGAASNIGIRPYDDVRAARGLDGAPRVYRDLGLVARLGADDAGDVAPSAYSDFERAPGTVRNEAAVVEYSRELARRVASRIGAGRFALVLGGDCSIVLGCLLGAGRAVGRVGLVYIDAHADFGTPDESITGSAASMCLAMAVGRGASRPARLGGDRALARPEDVVLIGRRDADQANYGHAALAGSAILDLPDATLRSLGPAVAARRALDRVTRSDVDGFWVHVDADVLDPDVLPAVDSPEAGGLDLGDATALVRPLVDHPKAVGMQLTIYDPRLDDADRTCGRRLVDLLEQILAPRDHRDTA